MFKVSAERAGDEDPELLLGMLQACHSAMNARHEYSEGALRDAMTYVTS